MTNLKQDFGSRYRATNDWRADVPMKTKPTIVKSRKIGGVEHLVTADKKLFIKSVFEKMWGEVKIA